MPNRDVHIRAGAVCWWKLRSLHGLRPASLARRCREQPGGIVGGIAGGNCSGSHRHSIEPLAQGGSAQCCTYGISRDAWLANSCRVGKRRSVHRQTIMRR